MANGCPKCHFQGANILPDGSRRCASCGQIYQQRIDFPAAPSYPGRAVPAGGGSRKVGVMIAVVIGVVVAVAAIGSALESSSDHSSSSAYSEPFPEPSRTAAATNAEPAVQPAPAVQPQPTAKISAMFSGQLRENSWWVVQYSNTSDVAISFPTVVISYTDKDGKKQTAKGISSVLCLPPRKLTWILLARKDVGPGDVTLEVDTPKVAFKGQQTYEILSLVSGNRNEDNSVVGRIANNTEHTLTTIRLTLIGYDANDKPCSYSVGYPNESTLAPGAESDFKLTADLFQAAGPPVRWEIDTWGRVKD